MNEPEDRRVALLDVARKTIAEAHTIEDVKVIRDKAAAIQTYLKQQSYNWEIQTKAAEMKVRAEYRMGQLLEEMEMHPGNRPFHDERAEPTKLSDMGIDYNQSHRYQIMAAVPEDQMDEYFEAVREKGPSRDITSKDLYRLGKEVLREGQRAANAAMIQREPPPFPDSKFKAIVIDPPWDWGDEGDGDQYGRARPTYATMPIDEIQALPVPTLAEDDAHLYLWITNRSLPKGFGLLTGWGFRYVTMLTWVKPSIGMGNYFRGSTEQVLFGVRGSLPLLRHDIGTHFTAPRPGNHSSKPDELYHLVETCSPGPWLDMFARDQRPGWTVWGVEA